MTVATWTHHFLLRGFEVDRKARAEALVDGSVIGASQWIVVPAGASISVDLTLTAAPGTYAARQATNFGSNVHENIVTNDLASFVHPVEDAAPSGQVMRVRYSGPTRGAHMLSKELEDAGLRVDFAAPMEHRGMGQEIVHLMMRVEADAEAGLVGAAAVAVVQRIVRAFKQRHPSTDAEVQDEQDE